MKCYVVYLIFLLLTPTLSIAKTLTVNPESTIEIRGVVDGKILEKADKLRALATKFDEVTIVINSPGGSVMAGSIFISQMEAVKTQGVGIRCIVTGLAASMATHILAHCTTRYAFFYSYILWHPARVGGLFFSVTADEAEYHARMLRIDEAPLNQYLFSQLNILRTEFDYHYKNESLIPAWYLSRQFIKLIDDVIGMPNLFAFEDILAQSIYNEYVQRSAGLGR